MFDNNIQLKICLISSFDDKCSVSNYSSLLLEGLKNQVKDSGVLIDRRTLPSIENSNKKDYKKLAQELKNYDIVHIQHEQILFGNYGYGVLPFYSNIPKHVKVITTIHEINPKPVSLTGHLSDHVLLKHVCSNSNLVIVHNVFSRNYLTRHKFCSGSKIQVIQHGLKIETLEKEEARIKVGLPLNRKIIVIPGNIRKSKQYEKILSKVSNEYLVIAAGNDVGEKHEDYIEYLKMYSNFRWIDKLNDEKLRDFIAAADIVALYYKTATVSSILFIAMGLYKKIISSNISIFREIQESYPSLKISKDNLIGEDIQKLYNAEVERVNLTGMTWEMSAQKHIEEYKKLNIHTTTPVVISKTVKGKLDNFLNYFKK